MRRIKVDAPSEFKDAMLQIKLFLEPVFEAICNEKEFLSALDFRKQSVDVALLSERYGQPTKHSCHGLRSVWTTTETVERKKKQLWKLRMDSIFLRRRLLANMLSLFRR